MAEIIVKLKSADGKEVQPNAIKSFELSRDISAVCDALRLRFTADEPSKVFVSAEVYLDGTKCFFGYVDTQRTTVSATGSEVFIYVRSSACILLNNEALPCVYTGASAYALFLKNAKPFGFSFGLSNVYSESDYIVQKGTTCYGAMNRFVSGLTGYNLLVSPDNELYLPSGKDFFEIDDSRILNEIQTINRGDIITGIDYKTEEDQTYRRHMRSKAFDDIGYERTRTVNLAALPEWQRQSVLKNMLRTAAQSYETVEIDLDGAADVHLYDKTNYPDKTGNYYVGAVRIIQNPNGTVTRLRLSKKIDLQEVIYVD